MSDEVNIIEHHPVQDADDESIVEESSVPVKGSTKARGWEKHQKTVNIAAAKSDQNECKSQ